MKLLLLLYASCCASFSGPTLADLGGTTRFLFAVEGEDPGVVDPGLRRPLCGVGMRLGVVLPELGVGKRLREPVLAGRLFVGSLNTLGEEEEMDFVPFKNLEPLGGSDETGFGFLELDVLAWT